MIKFSMKYKGKSPSRGTSKSAGTDVYVPEFSEEFKKEFDALQCKESNGYVPYLEKESIKIPPRTKVKIPTGLRTSFEGDSALIAFNKSGISWDKTLTLLACVCDMDYQGYIYVTMFNNSDNFVRVPYNSKITQLVRIPVIFDEWVCCPEDSLYTEETERKDGGFGSTGL